MKPWRLLLLVLLISTIVVARLHQHPPSSSNAIPLPATALAGEPRLMLWAWETPNDLTTLDTSQAGVAFLSRTLLLDSTPNLIVRREPLLLPPHAFLTAVVRIETGPHFGPNHVDVASIAQAILTAVTPSTRALQIDFDATASERNFYTALLRELRRRLPAGFPLSITALVSWCGNGSWLHGLPIDEAVPMFFRMGGPAATRASAPRSFSGITEPLCRSSTGISTDEAWPQLLPTQRVYVFHPGSWSRNDLAHVQRSGYSELQHLNSSAAQGTP